MVSFIALYRGESIGSAKLVATTAHSDVVREFAERMLLVPDGHEPDAVLRELSLSRRRALRLIRMTQNSKGAINYTLLPEATPESELDALAAVYAFVLECHERRKVADATGNRNEVKEDKDVDPTGSLP